MTKKAGGLSKEQHKFYKENGYCIVPDILDRARCASYLEAAEALVGTQEVKYAPMMNPDRQDRMFFELLRHKTIVACLEFILGSKVSGLQSMLYFKRPGEMGRDLHQDNFYAQADREAYMGTWLPLEDTDRENGGLIAYPGSHREPILDISADTSRQQTNYGDFKNDRGIPCVVPDGYKKKYLTVPAGAVVLIHGHLIHGSEENLSNDRFRRVFAGHYIKQGCSFRPGNHAKRTVIDLYSSAA